MVSAWTENFWPLLSLSWMRLWSSLKYCNANFTRWIAPLSAAAAPATPCFSIFPPYAHSQRVQYVREFFCVAAQLPLSMSQVSMSQVLRVRGKGVGALGKIIYLLSFNLDFLIWQYKSLYRAIIFLLFLFSPPPFLVSLNRAHRLTI